MAWYFRNGLITNIMLSVLVYGLLFFLAVPVIRIFNKKSGVDTGSPGSTAAVRTAPRSHGAEPDLHSVLLFHKAHRTANAIAVSHSIAVKALMFFCLPLLFGTEAIWLVPFIYH